MSHIESLSNYVFSIINPKKLQILFDSIAKHPHAEYLCIYGCGVSNQIFDSLEKKGINVHFFCESDGGGNIGKTFLGRNVIAYSELYKIKEKVLVIPDLKASFEIFSRLTNDGFPYVSYCTPWLIECLCSIKDIDTDEFLENIKRLLVICADEQSAYTVLIMLKNSLSIVANALEIKSVFVDNQYCIPGVFTLEPEEIIVDIGAYDGDTVKTFANVQPEYNTIHAVEMDVINFLKLKKNTEDLRNILYYNAAISDYRGETSYYSLNESSQINEGGGGLGNKQFIQVTTVDKLFNNERITYLKMDIEGTEIRALKGAETTIRRHKPKCAISVYHNMAHMFEVPFLLKQYVPEYKIYFRHHTDYFPETMCYAAL